MKQYRAPMLYMYIRKSMIVGSLQINMRQKKDICMYCVLSCNSVTVLIFTNTIIVYPINNEAIYQVMVLNITH